jgi:hypothetical protein
MSHDVYYQFLQHPGQARRAGARGGKATVRNRRERLDRTSAEVPEPEAETAPAGPFESTAAAIALLDAQYPWLRGAEKRFLQRSHRAGIQTETIPMLRKHKGFQGELTFVAPGGAEAVGISLWDEQQNADAYAKDGYSEVMKNLKKLLPRYSR